MNLRTILEAMLIRGNLLLKWLFVIGIILIIPGGAIVVFLIFLIGFIFKKVSNFEILLLYFLLFFVQKGLDNAESTMVPFLKIALIFLTFTKVNLNEKRSITTFLSNVPIFIIFILYLLIHSCFISYDPTNSLVETVNFLLLLSFTFHGTYVETVAAKARQVQELIALYLVIILTSYMTFLVPEIAYRRNGWGFQGISIHPNVFGVVLAPFCSYLLVRLFVRFTMPQLCAFFASMLLLYLSASRTAMLSVVLGTLTLIVIDASIRSTISKKVLVLVFWVSGFLVFSFETISSFILAFLKKAEGGDIVENIQASRGSLINAQLTNISEHPFFGIGLKIPSSLNVETGGFSIGKAYEKGNSMLASLEELGIIGFILLLIFIFSLLRRRGNGSSLISILSLTALFTTLGEATLFSIGGVGVLVWGFIFLFYHKAENTKVIEHSLLSSNNTKLW